VPRPVDPAIIEAVFADDGPLSALMPGYRTRRAQVDMALAVGRCLNAERGRLVVEAGTGTGKSLAYLVPMLLAGRRAVVATGTKALQDQLVDKDAPTAIAAVTAVLTARGQAPEQPLRVTSVKGRTNYLCLLRYERWQRQQGLAFDDDANRIEAALRTFAETTTTGDRAELTGLKEGLPIWGQLDCSKDHCLGSSCPRYDECFLVRSRRVADGAAVMVTNHALLCADLAMRQETVDGFQIGVLPAYDAVVVDEAHGLRDTATDHFGASVSLSETSRFSADLREQSARSGAEEQRRLQVAAQVVDTAAVAFFAALQIDEGERQPSVPPIDSERAVSRGAYVATDDIKEPARLLDRALTDAGTACDVARAAFDMMGSKDGLERAALAGLKGRADRLRAAVLFTTTAAPVDAGYVCFVDRGPKDTVLTAAPIDVGGPLAASLFGDLAPVVLTSATLAVGDDVSSFMRDVGLSDDYPPQDDSFDAFDASDDIDSSGDVDDDGNSDHDDDDGAGAQPSMPKAAIETAVFLSPFDHARRAALYAPTDMPLPDEPAYAARFDEELLFLLALSRGGALVLFTSHRAMEDAVRRLRPSLQRLAVPLLKQGDRPKAALLDELRAHGDAALFATSSFWEGIDVQGAALRLVVIDRLPFRVPSDPLVRARADAITRAGKDAFSTLSVPEAALALKQGAGRLLRSVDDAGVVAVLDGRLRKRRYGASMLGALPPMTRVGSRRTVAQFWLRYVEPALGLSGSERPR